MISCLKKKQSRLIAFTWALTLIVSCAHAQPKHTSDAIDSRVAIKLDRKPNIVFIMVDDMARDWVSCYGSSHKTPNIDKLAKQGIRYDVAWSMPICTPTRVTLLSGQYPFRHGWITHHDVPRWGGPGLDWKKHTTWPRVLRDAGYKTVVGGKWQINDLSRQPDALKSHGFDEHCVWPGAEKDNNPSGERYWNGYIQTNGKRAVAKYGPDTINKYLVDFVGRHAKSNKDQPFLIYYPMMLTHGPFGTTPLNKDEKSTDKETLYAGYVDYMDMLVGQLVDAIDKAGFREHTMIVFTGDNGSSASGMLNGIPLPKGKGRHADYGVHVPFIVRAPFLIPQTGLRSNDLLDFTDIYPTFVKLAGAKLPASQKLDGVSLLPSLSGDEDPFKKRNWIFAQIKEFRMIRDWQFLLDNEGGFYQINSDPGQEKNLIESNEKIIPGRRARLKMLLNKFPPNAPSPFKGFGQAK